jgi:hypothetical protein
VDVRTDVNFPVLFQGSHATLRREAESYGRRFVFRKYVNPELLNGVLTNTEPKFIETSYAGSLCNGKKGVDPELLLIKLGAKTYKLSRDYAKHLKAENVWFNCPENPPLEPLGLDVDAPTKVNDEPIYIPRRM